MLCIIVLLLYLDIYIYVRMYGFTIAPSCVEVQYASQLGEELSLFRRVYVHHHHPIYYYMMMIIIIIFLLLWWCN